MLRDYDVFQLLEMINIMVISLITISIATVIMVILIRIAW